MPNNKKWLDIIRAQEQSRDLHQTFHDLLNCAEDPFSLVASYFGRSIFKKLTVITEWPQSQQKTFEKKDNIKSTVDSTNPFNEPTHISGN